MKKENDNLFMPLSKSQSPLVFINKKTLSIFLILFSVIFISGCSCSLKFMFDEIGKSITSNRIPLHSDAESYNVWDNIPESSDSDSRSPINTESEFNYPDNTSIVNTDSTANETTGRIISSDTTVYQSATDAPHEHQLIIDEKVPASCTSTGLSEGYHCSICGEIILAQTIIDKIPHSPVIDNAVEATCSSTGLTEGSHCGVCQTVIIAQKVVPKAPHKTVIDLPVQATCQSYGLTEGSHCSVCGAVIVAQKTIPKTDHNPYVSIEAKNATANTSGHTEEIRCAICGIVLSESTIIPATGYSDPQMYAGMFGYNYLSNLSKSSSRQKFYKKLESISIEFHKGKTDAGYNLSYNDASLLASIKESGCRIVSDIDTSSYKLTSNELSETWMLFKYDHPLYYWIPSGYIYYSVGGNIHFLFMCSDEYSKGEVISSCNQLIYEGVEQLHILSSDKNTAYGKALAVHDGICEKIKYRFGQDGKPDNSAESHSIMGWFNGNGGVCECYSKTFSLMMNFLDIECVTVINAEHMWNLIKLEDGKWYWVDVTHDDPYNLNNTVLHIYFCKNDTEEIYIGSGYMGSGSFLDQSGHTLLPPGNGESILPDDLKEKYPGSETYSDIGLILIYSLPERASSPYSGPTN